MDSAASASTVGALPSDEARLPWAPVQALGVFVDLLAEIESATPSSSEFYDRLCEATCRLAHLRRAVVFLWDESRREVRPVGSRGVDLSVFADAHVGLHNVPIARAALTGDCVVEARGQLEEHAPAELIERLHPRHLLATPMSAGGVWFGAMIAEREDDAELGDAERHTLWVLGKVAALAASARIATRQQEHARRLGERIDLARDLHESVVQRLFAVGMVLGASEELSAEDRARCLREIDEAKRELRIALQRPLARSSPETSLTLAEELQRLQDQHPELGLRLRWETGLELPARFEALAQSVLSEAIRNARKHARPTAIDVVLGRERGTVVLQVLNDGILERVTESGMGLRLAALEALHLGAAVEFGREERGRWRVRLVMPLEAG